MGLSLGRIVLLAVPLLAVLAASSPAQAPTPTCFGQRATIVGGPGNDTMTGGPGPDVMVGEGGNDTMNGMGGNDLICGDDGSDTINGGGGTDRIDGGTENDSLNGGSGDDMVDGGTGSDLVQGGDGNDTVNGGGGDNTDVLRGGPGNDTIIGQQSGQASPDEVDYSQSGGAVNVDLQKGTATGEGTDTLQGIDWVAGSSFNDTIAGNSDTNVINGGLGNDHINGGPGGDLLSGDGGDDVVDGGGAGGGTGTLQTDYLVYSNAPGAVDVDFPAGKTSGWGNDTVTNIGGVFGSKFGDLLIGSDTGTSLLWGAAGDDELRGQGGDDRALFSSPVDASLARGTATGEGTDKLVGISQLEGSSGSDRLTGDGNANVLIGGPGGNDVIDGGGGPDALVSGGASTLDGGAGADRLDGGSANDTLDGGAGDDLLSGGAGNNSLDGGDGTDDTVSYFGSTKAANVDLAAGTGVADGTDQLKNVESVVGTKHDDTLKGNGQGNSLQGGDGNDALSGGAGADFLDGGVGSNTLDGGPGNDYCLQKGRGCEVTGAPFVPGKAPLPPGVTPPSLFSFIPALVQRADEERVLQALQSRTTPTHLARPIHAYVLALSAQLAAGPASVEKGETAAYKYAAEPVCFATKPFHTEIAPPRSVSPIAGDSRPEEGWWQGTLYRLVKGKYKKFKTTPWARAQLQGGAAVPGVTLWRNQTGKLAFPNTISVKVKKGRYVWKGNIYWVRSGGQVFAPIEPHIIRAKTVRFNKQCVF